MRLTLFRRLQERRASRAAEQILAHLDEVSTSREQVASHREQHATDPHEQIIASSESVAPPNEHVGKPGHFDERSSQRRTETLHGAYHRNFTPSSSHLRHAAAPSSSTERSARVESSDAVRQLQCSETCRVRAVHNNSNGEAANIKPPAAVTNAIANFPTIPGLTLKPPSDKETSYIYQWGVRVEIIENGDSFRHWLCLADETCRLTGTNFTLSYGRTSKPANHLATVHEVVSVRTQSQQRDKRKREDKIERLRSSSLYKNDPRRFALPTETQRIINHNLAFMFGEYKESHIIEELLKRDEMQTAINSAKVTRVIIELYSSSKTEIMSVLEDSRLGWFGNFAVMSDFSTCSMQHKKFMGLRVYFIDSNWEYRSILLGVRMVSPSYGDRERGIQGHYKAWTLQVLSNFGLTINDFFGATSDGGSDVKHLLRNKSQLKWEWCMEHMAHAATKEVCGVNTDAERSRNPEMTKLIGRIKKIISNVQSIKKTGDLFAALCRTQTTTPTAQLLSYAANRVLGITGILRRILDKWPALEDWYEERGG